MTGSRLGETLRAARRRAGWSRETLAHHSGLTWSAITQIESGRRRDVRLSSLVALADALGVSLDYLAGGRSTLNPDLLGHQVLPYGSDEEFLATAEPFLREGIQASEAVLAVTTTARTDLLREAFGTDVGGIEFRDSADWYGSPARAWRGYSAFLEGCLEAGRSWVRILGEPPWVLCTDADIVRWGRYESLINLGFAASPTTIVCPYDTRALAPEIVTQALSTHPDVAGSGATTSSPTYEHPEDFLFATP